MKGELQQSLAVGTSDREALRNESPLVTEIRDTHGRLAVVSSGKGEAKAGLHGKHPSTELRLLRPQTLKFSPLVRQLKIITLAIAHF